MEQVLKDAFGRQCKKIVQRDVQLPASLTEHRLFYDIQIMQTNFILVQYTAENRFQLASLKRQFAAYSGAFGLPIAFGFPTVTTFQRKALVENEIPFVSDNGQIFLPFIGVLFSHCPLHPVTEPQAEFTPSTQALFLLLLYLDDGLTLNKSQAAERLKLTPMSITRAAAHLQKLGILAEKKDGKEVRICRTIPKEAAFCAAEHALLSPVCKRIYTPLAELTGEKTPAGESALALRTGLCYPPFPVYAMCKDAPELKSAESCDPGLDIDRELAEIEIWRYDPALFFCDGRIDPVSLICSLREERDERIQQSLVLLENELRDWNISI